jgi:anti-sigma-K factor RskA
MARAGDYVLGLMSDAERERAERDLELDPAFRDAVLQLAQRMHVIGRGGAARQRAEERWRQIADRIAEMPQMRAVPQDGGEGRRAALARRLGSKPAVARQRSGPGLHPAGMALAIALIFGLGYLCGRFL